MYSSDKLIDPYVKLFSIKFWFKYFIRKLAYNIPPQELKIIFGTLWYRN